MLNRMLDPKAYEQPENPSIDSYVQNLLLYADYEEEISNELSSGSELSSQLESTSEENSKKTESSIASNPLASSSEDD